MRFYILKFLKKYKFNLTLIIFFSILLPIINNLIPRFSKDLLDKGVLLKNIPLIFQFSFFIILFSGLKYLLNNIIQSKVLTINLDAISTLKKDVLNSTINLPMTFHDKNSSQYILSRINEVDNLSKLFSSDLILFIINIFTALVAFISIIQKNIIIAILTITFIPLFIFLSSKTFKKINTQISNSLENYAITNNKMHSALNGTLTLKQFNEENKLLEDININIDNLSNTLYLQSLTINKNINLISFYTTALQTFLVGITATFIVNDSLSIGDYFLISQSIGLINAPVLLYQNIRLNIKPALISYKRLKSFYKSDPQTKKDCIIKSIHNITVSDLSFQYTSDKPILKDIDFNLTLGDKFLISGQNGSGKTTLSKLILGFYDNYSGSIHINNTNLHLIDEASLRERISIVPQKSYLFDMSLLENIKMSNNKLTDNEFIEKIDYLKSIHLFDGIDLNIKSIENGKNLSGGQIQRISLARILIRDFDVCIFDEITNSLDIESKDIIKNIITNEFNNKICIFISHNDYLDDLVTKKLTL